MVTWIVSSLSNCPYLKQSNKARRVLFLTNWKLFRNIIPYSKYYIMLYILWRRWINTDFIFFCKISWHFIVHSNFQCHSYLVLFNLVQWAQFISDYGLRMKQYFQMQLFVSHYWTPILKGKRHLQESCELLQNKRGSFVYYICFYGSKNSIGGEEKLGLFKVILLLQN